MAENREKIGACRRMDTAGRGFSRRKRGLRVEQGLERCDCQRCLVPGLIRGDSTTRLKCPVPDSLGQLPEQSGKQLDSQCRDAGNLLPTTSGTTLAMLH